MMLGFQHRLTPVSAPGGIAGDLPGKRPAKKQRKGGGGEGSEEGALEEVRRMAAENAVMVFSKKGCCMCHVVNSLLCTLGVHPAVCELDQQGESADEYSGDDLETALARIVRRRPAVPAVFIGGELVGGLDNLMAAHISGDLVPRLKSAGALWL